jgi:hypothetical protein
LVPELADINLALWNIEEQQNIEQNAIENTIKEGRTFMRIIHNQEEQKGNLTNSTTGEDRDAADAAGRHGAVEKTLEGTEQAVPPPPEKKISKNSVSAPHWTPRAMAHGRQWPNAPAGGDNTGRWRPLTPSPSQHHPLNAYLPQNGRENCRLAEGASSIPPRAKAAQNIPVMATNGSRAMAANTTRAMAANFSHVFPQVGEHQEQTPAHFNSTGAPTVANKGPWRGPPICKGHGYPSPWEGAASGVELAMTAISGHGAPRWKTKSPRGNIKPPTGVNLHSPTGVNGKYPTGVNLKSPTGVNLQYPTGVNLKQSSDLQKDSSPLPLLSSAALPQPVSLLDPPSEQRWKGIPLWERLQRNLPWWENHAPHFVVNLIKQGVTTDHPLPPVMSRRQQSKTPQEINLATTILEDYLASGAVRRVQDPENTRHLVPWFVLSKPEQGGVKNRLIADCRELNQFCSPERFSLETMATIFPLLKQGWYSAKVDLKDAYFHLRLQPHLQKYVRMQVGPTTWEFLGAPFGLNILPKLFTALLKPLQKLWRSKGLMVFVYLDDIILFGSTENMVKKQLKFLLETLDSAGFKISEKKSVLVPTQKIQHLGFVVNLEQGQLEVPSHKLKTIRKELGKVILAEKMTCRKMSSILGQIRSYLVALPFLRLVTQRLLRFSQSHMENGWDHSIYIPQDLKEEIHSLKTFLEPGKGRPFIQEAKRTLHSDSSTWAWGGDGYLPTGGRWHHSGFLEKKPCATYQHQRTYGSSLNSSEFRQAWRNCATECRQPSGTFVPQKMGGQKRLLEQNSGAPFSMVLGKQSSAAGTMGTFSPNVGRPFNKVEPGQGRLYPVSRLISKNSAIFRPPHKSRPGYVFQPGKCKIPKICHQAPPPPIISGGCHVLRPGGGTGNLCQPPLENNHAMVGQIEPKQKTNLFTSHPYVGFKCLVAPINKNVQAKDKDVGHPPRGGMFTNCWGELMPAPRWPLACTIVSGSFWNNNKLGIKKFYLP